MQYLLIFKYHTMPFSETQAFHAWKHTGQAQTKSGERAANLKKGVAFFSECDIITSASASASRNFRSENGSKMIKVHMGH